MPRRKTIKCSGGWGSWGAEECGSGPVFRVVSSLEASSDGSGGTLKYKGKPIWIIQLFFADNIGYWCVLKGLIGRDSQIVGSN